MKRGDKDTEFMFDPELIGERVRKTPESEVERRLDEVRQMEEQDFRNLKRKLNSSKPLTAAEAKRLDGYRERLEVELGQNLPEHVVKTQREVAEFFKKNVRTVKRWVSKGMPALPDAYDLLAIETWAIREGLIGKRELKERKGGNGDGNKRPIEEIDAIDYKQENEKLKLKVKKFEFAQRLGKFISRDEVEKENVAKITIVKRALLAQPRSIAPRLVGLEAREIEALLMEHNRDIITRFAQKNA